MLRAYGDCVISLGLLEKLPKSAEVRIIGTDAAQHVANALSFDHYPIESVLSDVAAFFDVRRAGAARAISDLQKVRRALRHRLRPGDTVIFEQPDWRNRWVAPVVPGITTAEPFRGRSVYEDRRALLVRTVAELPAATASRRPTPPVRQIVLNPGARIKPKRLPPAVIENVIQYAAANAIEVCLLDPEEQHSYAAPNVAHYWSRPSLPAAIEMLRRADLYIGADSFFLHLAYYFQRPLFAIVPSPISYFAPPALQKEGGTLTISEAMDLHRMAAALDAFCR